MSDVNSGDIRFAFPGDDLVISNAADAADGSLDEGVVIEDQYAGSENAVETLFTADGGEYALI